MKKSILKSVSISLAAAVLLIGCASNDAHPAKKGQSKYMKDLKKKRMEKVGGTKAEKTKADLKKFCFKDNRSIHYRNSERCK